jgi:hypothetical protein
MFEGASKRSPGLLGLLLAVAVATLTASCTAAPRQAADLAQAKANCAAVGRELGAPPGDQGVWIREIIAAPRSGISAIDTPMLELAVALRRTSTARTGQAFSGTVQACARLGLWQTYH